MLHTSTDRWYFTADRSRVVRESDPAAAFLLVAVGGQIPMADAIRYGIVDTPGAAPDAVSVPAPTNDTPDVETPAVDDSAPIENKVVTPKRRKR